MNTKVTLAIELELKSESALIPYDALLRNGTIKKFNLEQIMVDPDLKAVLMSSVEYALSKAKSAHVMVVGMDTDAVSAHLTNEVNYEGSEAPDDSQG